MCEHCAQSVLLSVPGYVYTCTELWCGAAHWEYLLSLSAGWTWMHGAVAAEPGLYFQQVPTNVFIFKQTLVFYL